MLLFDITLSASLRLAMYTFPSFQDISSEPKPKKQAGNSTEQPVNQQKQQQQQQQETPNPKTDKGKNTQKCETQQSDQDKEAAANGSRGALDSQTSNLSATFDNPDSPDMFDDPPDEM